ncbi:MAG: hypothetical protein A3H96_06780 [Acidobacteria bacterium RIFCSPLOWO2_02_FULL_67_36]|nr:MAG: hypothetical protein A3H96_06780 [Acidobacteria bacterium RIFCSPLOWO2_02_FULL_67_36]OFW21320.1 MAG: hypothetical protein A3G21_11675 [Acidobacteria bacterium RIFCSPLOWO2_12_FULL_66_21]
MRRVVLLLLIASLAAPGAVSAQRRRAPVKKPAAVPLKTDPADLKCPESLGTGVKTGASYCFVLAGRDPAQGVIVTIPSHAGPASLLFELHNRHTYSEEDIRAGRGYAKYTAVIGVLSMKSELLGRAAVQSEFRAARDLHERISGGAGPGGVKAVAPIGREQIAVTIPAGVEQVSLLGEVLDATTAAGHEIASPGRPVALVSHVRIEYRPAPPPRTRKK